MLTAASIVDRWIVQQIQVVILYGLAVFERLKGDPLNDRITARIGKDSPRDLPFAAVCGGGGSPVERTLIGQNDFVLVLLALLGVFGMRLFCRVNHHKLHVDVLRVVERGIEDFGKNSVGPGEVDARSIATRGSQKIFGSIGPHRRSAWRTRRILGKCSPGKSRRK